MGSPVSKMGGSLPLRRFRGVMNNRKAFSADLRRLTSERIFSCARVYRIASFCFNFMLFRGPICRPLQKYSMKTVIIGSGNVATVFGESIVAAGHPVLQVLAR